ncbi:alanine aminotransferase 2 [Thecamonas trahens ATCC 50062]|uniref:Alanine aminotransferase 2 n=1 Tax=Thecamonas trahens ATCC 50062 TaxID=461836 RepID=A0A0L0DDP3_THETB|nr:alanine aminotransferase 2 [Thecamonas trahens ATCC 50062]KNC50429.1 alanine aminotransferase 2 [Thecamonas trahens ATCC 50062]|eukprot:XP_013756969.1 alanine aminotransferase 2 [Thecamonas trahens ATCC 50062]
MKKLKNYAKAFLPTTISMATQPPESLKTDWLTLPTSDQVFHPSNLNPHLVKMEYAVRGLLVQTAEKLEAQLRRGELDDAPFDKIVYCNIGNPQALDDIALTFIRQVLALVTYPGLIDAVRGGQISEELFPSDTVARAEDILASVPGGVGAYSHSMGIPYVRQKVAQFIEERDGYPSDPEAIFITDGASPGISTVIQSLIRGPNDGILLPVPQYPLYSATVAACGGTQVDYYLDEANGWSLDVAELDRAVTEAKANGVGPRALAVINPGNPTGQVMSANNIADVIQFCADHHLIVLADEVYQENVYDPDNKPFVSFKKALMDSAPGVRDRVELFSFHSVSKGMLGECGLRGGYMEAHNIHHDGMAQLYKNVSVSLCSNTIGQLTVGLMVDPPQLGDPSYHLYTKQYRKQYKSLKRRALALTDALNSMEGVSCKPASGAMYAFPQITLPAAVAAAASDLYMSPDTYYCLELLKGTGVCVVPGSGFGQVDGTYHFRTTFLPPEHELAKVGETVAKWHAEFMDKHRGS